MIIVALIIGLGLFEVGGVLPKGLAGSLRWLIGWHIDLIRLKMSSHPPRLSNPDLRSLLRGWAERQTPRRRASGAGRAS